MSRTLSPTHESAKFSPGLIQKTYSHCLKQGYLKKNNICGDPFGGVGCGGIFAAYAGISWIGVELEAKFVDLANQNFDLHRVTWRSYGYPEPVIVQSDSRHFGEIMTGDWCCCEDEDD